MELFAARKICRDVPPVLLCIQTFSKTLKRGSSQYHSAVGELPPETPISLGYPKYLQGEQKRGQNRTVGERLGGK